MEERGMTVTQLDLEQSDLAVADLAETGAIARISEPTIQRYFETFNAGDFEATANLFATDGALHPPFESAIVGNEAIAAYLNTEAKGMKVQPREGMTQMLETGDTEVKVTGQVQTPLFGVNVAWFFVLNNRSEIVSAEIKLLAKLEELLKLKR